MIKVVVVEDEPLVRKGIVLAVDWSSMGCIVVGDAENGKEGIELINRYNPDIVVTDIRMPIMDGLEMIRHLKNDGKCEAGFIILTAYTDFAYAHNALRLHVADYLLKPFKDGQLEEAIEKIKNRLPKQPVFDDPVVLNFNKDKSKYVTLAIEYLRKNYSDPDISVGQVAEHLGISEGHLSRIFKKETNYTFVSYLTHYRVQAAMRLLKCTKVKVYEVALQVGYRDTTYFSTTFKRFAGISPSEYQDRC